MNLPSMLHGESMTRLMQGAAAGAILTAVVGFGWGGWTLGSKAEAMAQKRADSAVVAVLAPICVEKFQRAAEAKSTLIAMKAVDEWRQDTFVEKGGWATFAGSAEPKRDVAGACAKMLNELK